MSSPAYSYAKAVNELLKKEQLSEFLKCFQEISPILQEQEQFFISPVYSLDFKKQALSAALASIKSSLIKPPVLDLLKDFFLLLLDRSRWREWPKILQYLEKIHQDLQNVVVAEVISTHPLSSDLKSQLKKKLEAFFKKLVVLRESRSSDLLAGIKIKAGGFIFDDSMFFHLKQMELEARRGFYVNTGQ